MFIQRALVTLILGPLALSLVFLGGWYFFLPVTAVLLIATAEYLNIIQKIGWQVSRWLLFFAVLLQLILAQWPNFGLASADLFAPITLVSSLLIMAYALWLYELGTFEAVPLGFYDEDFHEVGVSQNGRYLSLTAGSGYGDACGIDRAFYIMQLNDAGQRTNLYELAQFDGIPRGQTGHLHSFYPANSGEWVSGNAVALEINATCLTEETIAELDIMPPGIYQLDVAQLTATRISDLPSE